MIACFYKQSLKFVFLFFCLFLSTAFTESAQAQDYDCSLAANCNAAAGTPQNTYCVFPVTTEKGCRCFDGIDNDGDGKVDKADSNCATYYGLTFVGEGSDCSITPPGSNTPYDLVNAPITSSQNTADTQSKVNVGDVDGDGIPDAIITSKWNSEIRVVATTGPQADGTKAGDIKSDFNLSGNEANNLFSATPNSGDCKVDNGDRLLYEHENLIADIDGNGKGEMYGIISNRNNSSKAPPACFYLVGFTYAPATLSPLFKAVAIGTDRPGTFGIADMDGDGKAELYMRDRIYAAENGVLLATATGTTSTTAWDVDVTSAPVAANISGDNKLELIVGTKVYSIPSLTNRTPASPASMTLVHDMNTIGTNDCYVKLMVDPVEYGTDTHSSTSIADIDRDGNIDIVISGALNATDGKTAVFYWNVAKSKVSYYLPIDPSNANGWPWGTGRVNLIDTDKDGRLDFFFIAGNQLYRLETAAGGDTFEATINSAQTGVTSRTINDSRSGVVSVTLYDFDNDADFELVYRDSQELAIVDADNLATKEWSAVCQSHTYTEGPIIADVNGDGGTDICVACNTSNSFDITDDIQQQALGQFRLYYSSGNEWLPTRKVWNQPGYFVVNVNDDLTLPFPQLDQTLVFGTAPCPNGLPGPQQPLNVFMDQVPYLSANGCPVFPAPDLAFFGDDPDNPTVDIDGVAGYTPAVEIIPPTCGDNPIQVRVRIRNEGDLPITSSIPVAFFKGDPTVAGATLIETRNVQLTNLAVDALFTSNFMTINSDGTSFRLYVVLNNNGATLPINLSGSSTTECTITNNMYDALVDPLKFEIRTVLVHDNEKCANTAPDNGALQVQVWRNGAQVMDLSPYTFQWYTGPTTAPVLIAGQTGSSLTNRPEGIYSVQGTHIAKGCKSTMVQDTISRVGFDFTVTANVVQDQTKCSPADGSLQAVVAEPGVYTYKWYDVAFNSLNVTTATINGLSAGNYIVEVTRDGCTEQATAEVKGPVIPEGLPETLADVEDCSNPTSGSVTATALVSGTAQDPAGYTFDWYFYNNATSTRGSVLPVTHGTGQTRTNLPAGYYEVVIKNNTTNCATVSIPPLITQVGSNQIIPTVVISQVAPQTSCDPANPNGILTAVATGTGLTSPTDYTFEWFKGNNTLPANLHTTVSGAKGETAEKVAGGGIVYTVRATTALNCSATNTFVITEDLARPVLTLTPSPNATCDPGNATSNYSGTMTATVTFKGSTVTLPDANYSFNWYNGSQITDPAIVPADAKNPVLPNLNGGSYTGTVTRTDISCTSDPDTKLVLNTPILPVITTTAVGSTNCAGGVADGSVTVATVTPNNPHTYKWYDPSNVLIGGQTAATLANLQGGPAFNYRVEVTYTGTGCVGSLSTNVPDIKASPVITLTSTDNTFCSPVTSFDGTASQASLTDVNANPGDTYSYVWSTGSDMTSPIGGATSSSITGKNGGFYTATATNGTTKCTSAPVTVEIKNNQILPALSANPTPSTNCNTTHNGQMVGTVTNPGADSFTFIWRKGNTLADPAVAQSSSTNISSTITGQQGAQNYFMQATNNRTGCVNTLVQTIPDASAAPVLTLQMTPNSGCVGGLFTGSASVSTITGANELGADTYTFAWSTGNDMTAPFGGNDGTETGLDGGFYTATATNDRLGCTSNPVTIQVTETIILPAIVSDERPSTNCNLTHNGGVDVTISNAGADTFTFLWTKGDDAGDPAIAAGDIVSTTTTSSINNQQGGQNYFIRATNNTTGCVNSFVQTISDGRVLPVLTLQMTPNAGCTAGLFTGTASSASITGLNELGADTYTFAWSNGNDMTSPRAGTTNSQSGLDGGFYTATVTNDRLGCTSNPVTIQVTEVIVLPAIASTERPSTNCNLTHNGGVDVTISNAGADAFTFLWTKGDDAGDPAIAAGDIVSTTTTSSINNQQGGQNYFVRATNNTTGCVNSFVQTISDGRVLPVLTLQMTPNAGCTAGLFTGTASSASITGLNELGADTYTFAWSNGNDMTSPRAGTTNSQSGLDGGFYTATVTNDRLGCTSNPVTIQVTETIILPAIVSDERPSTNCNLTHNGGVDVTISNAGADAFTFLWTKGDDAGDPAIAAGDIVSTTTTSSINNQQGGQNYFVRATNNTTGCVNSFVQTISDGRVLPVLTLQMTPNAGCTAGLFTGTASSASVTGANELGTDTYTYAWSDGNDMSAPRAGTTNSQTGLDGGFYTATVTNDRLGCTSNAVTIQVTEVIVLPAIVATPTPSTNCDLDHNGRIDVDINTPGAHTYAFVWRKGDDIADPAVPAGDITTTANTSDAINLEGGVSYFIQVTNNTTGCVNTHIQALADESEVPVLTLEMQPNSGCVAGLFTGEASSLSVTGTNELGTDTYTYAWATGSDMSVPRAGTTDTQTGLDGGFYTATVTNDRLGCTSNPVTIQVTEVIVLPAIVATPTPSTNCDLDHNGRIDVDINTPGAHTYAFVWRKGDDIADPAVPAGDITTTANTSDAINLEGGVSYFIQVTNNTTGCVNTHIQALADESEVPVLTLEMQPNSGCVAGLFTGEASSLSVTGTNELGTDTYTYAWATGSDMSVPRAGTTDTQTGLDGGFYTATVTNDRLGCTSNPVTIQVTEVIVLPAIVATPTPSTNCDVNHNGRIDVDINTPGAHIYTFVWRKGDDIGDPAVPAADITTTANTSDAVKLEGGVSYFIQVTNNTTGCVNSHIQALADESEPPVLTLQMDPNEGCEAGKYTGIASMATLTDVNDEPGDSYTYAWSTGNDMSAPRAGNTDTQSNLDGGFYTATVTNVRLGCTSNPVSIQVTNNQVIPAIATVLDPSTNCPGGAHNGGIDANVTNNPLAQPLTFQWYVGNAVAMGSEVPNANGGNTDIIFNVAGATTYTVFVENTTTGCENTFSQPLQDISALPTFSVAVVNNVNCTAPFNGAVSVTAIADANSEATDEYTIEWWDGNSAAGGADVTINDVLNNGALATTSDYPALATGFYTAKITNERLNCISTAVIGEVLNSLVLPVIDLDPTGSTNCAGGTDNGSILATITNAGTDVFNLQWYNGNTAAVGMVNGGVIANVTGNTKTGLTGGNTYTLEAINQTTRCASNEAVLVPDNRQLPVITALDVVPNTNCTAPFNGAASVNNATPFTYRGTPINTGPAYAGFTLTWSGGTANGLDAIQALPAGTYSLTVTANNNSITGNNDNCISIPVSVTVLDVLTYPGVTIDMEPQTSCGAPNGILEAVISSPAGTEVIKWFEGVGTGGMDITVAGSEEIITGLDSDDYTVSVTNATRCVTTITTFLPDDITPPTILLAPIADNTRCDNPNAVASVTVTDLVNDPGTSDPDYQVFYVNTFSLATNPQTPPSTEAAILAGNGTIQSTNGTIDPAAIPNIANLDPGFLTALVVDRYTDCISTPMTIQLDNATSAYTFDIISEASAGFCTGGVGGPGGGIELEILKDGAPCGTCATEWYRGTPVNSDIDYFNVFPDMTGATFITNNSNLGAPADPFGVISGTYTVLVEDGANGCGDFLVDIVPLTTSPTVDIDEVDATKCVAPFDGSLDVTVNGPSANGYTIEIYSGNAPILANKIAFINAGGAGFPNTDVDLFKDLLASGDYYVNVIDLTPANVTCPLGSSHFLDQRGLSPIVTVDDVVANTACTNAFANGQVELTIEKDPSDLRAAAGLTFEITTVSPVPSNPPGVPQTFPGVATVTTTLNYGFRPTTYMITVTETSSGCARDQSVTIPDQPEVPQIIQTDSIAEAYCFAQAMVRGTGEARVMNVSPGTVNSYEYSWATNNDMTGGVYGPVSGAAGGAVLDGSKFAAWWTAQGSGIGNREYYVRGTRLGPGVGAGCKTPVVKVVVPDIHVTPDPVFTPFSNTSCTPGTGEGTIEAIVTNAAASPSVDFNYTIGATTNGPFNGTTQTEVFNALEANTYAVRTANALSQCAINTNVVIDNRKYSLDITDHAFTHQLICNAYGDITVEAITIDRTLTGDPNVLHNTSALLNANYDFKWYRAPVATPGTFADPANRISDTQAIPALIVSDKLEAGAAGVAGVYPTMGEGTYYVIGQKTTAGGLGCETQPVRVDIEDRHVNPVVTLTPFTNTSCDPGVFEGELKIKVTDASTVLGPFGADFNYDWDAATATPIADDAGNNGNELNDGGDQDHFTFLQDGTYTVTVLNSKTGCSTTAASTILENTIPVFVTDFDVVPQFYCDPSGRITVTSISYEDRTGTTVNLLPADADFGDFEFTWTRVGTGVVGGITNRLDSAAGNYPGIGADMYQVFTERVSGSPGNGCISAPVNIEIQDKTIYPVITLTPFSNTSCTTDFEGQIEVDVTDNSVAKVPAVADNYTYTWSAINPVALTLPTVGNAAQTGVNNLYPVPADPAPGLEEGTYGISVENNVTGCVTTAQTTIIKNQTPVFVTTVDMLPQLFCDESGSAEVKTISYNDRNGTNVTGDSLLTRFEYRWFRNNVTSEVVPFNAATQIDSTNYNAIAGFPDMGFGTYFVVAKRTIGYPGAGCESAPFRIDITDKRVFPVVTLTPFSNTSCNTDFEGQIEVDVTDNSVAKVPAVADNYTYTWSAINPVALTLPTVGNAAQTGVNNRYPVPADPAPGLEEGTYGISVENNVTGCVTTAQTTIIKNQTPVFVTTVDMLPQFFCDESGSAEVKTISYNDRNGTNVTGDSLLTRFQYRWFRNDITTQVLGFNNATQIDSSNYVGTVPLPDMGFGTYYVVARRTVGYPGAGCESAPFRVDITDQRVFPVVTLTPFSNTSCTTDFEGQIEVDVTDASVNKVPPAADNYTYTWSAINPVALTLPTVGNAAQTGVNNLYPVPADPAPGLEEGTYGISVENNVTGCVTTAQTTIVKNQTPVFVTTVDMLPQFFCDESGSAEVKTISYNDRNGTNVTGDSLLNRFQYRWFRNNVTTEVLGFNNATQLDSSNYVGTVPLPDMGFGTYYVVARRTVGYPGAGCESAPFRIDITDERDFPVATLTPFSNTSCTMAFEGEIEVDVTDASEDKTPAVPFAYNYTWTVAATPIAPSALIDGVNDRFTGLEDGAYTLQVENDVTGCTTTASTSIIKNQTPVFLTVVNTTPQFYCDPSGNLRVTGVTFQDRDGVTQTGNTAHFTYDWFRGSAALPAIAQTVGSDPRGTILDSLEYATIGADENYFVVATRTTGAPGAGCSSAPIKVEIADKRQFPLITLTPFSNTSCTAAFEGEIEVDVTDASVAKTPLDPFNYDYAWTTAPNPVAPSAGIDGLNDRFTGLEDGSYTIQVTNNVTNCVSTASTSIIKNQTPVFLTVVNTTPQFYCDPSGNLEVTTVTFEDRNGVTQTGNIADFNYSWFRGSAALPAIANTIGNLPKGNILDSAAYGAIGADENYFVIATRRDGTPGAGCSSAPIKVEIADKRQFPLITLTPFSNTSCTAAFEGEIEVDVTDASVAKTPADPFNYDYAWTTAPNPVAPSAGIDGLNDRFTGLEDGSYTIQVTNNVTTCVSTASTSIIKNQTPVFLTVVNTTPQFYCDPSGNLRVTGVTFQDRDGVTQTGNTAHFTYDWFRGSAALPAIAQTVGSDPRGTILDSLEYATIGADENYFVIATRTTGAPGAGCSSAPIKVEIADKRQFPVITLTPFSNTACNNVFEGSLEVNISDNSVAKTPSAGPINYNYTWTTAQTPIAPGLAQDGIADRFNNLEDGAYTLQAVNNITGCTNTGSATILKNSIPVFVQSVASVPQMFCLPSGHLEVKSITFEDASGATQNGSTAEFTYQWFRGNVTTSVGNTNGALARGTFLDSLSYVPVTTEGIGFDTYFVVTTRAVGAPGNGCSSAPFRVDILDKRDYPVVGFDITANTACDGNFDGTITVLSSTKAGSPGAASNYDIAWTEPAGSTVADVTNVGASYTTTGADVVGPGVYDVVVTNRVTNCPMDGSVTMVTNEFPLEILTVSKTDQMICNPDGSITVQTMAPAAVGNYTFNWFRGSTTTPALVHKVTSATITGNVLNVVNYDVEADTYYVVGTRNGGSDPGSGCETPPFEIKINDLHTDPLLAFSSTANSACNVLKANGSVAVQASEVSGPAGNYNFNWVFNGGPQAAVSTATTSTVSSAADGIYDVTAVNNVTGCSTIESFKVALDTTRSTPNIIDVITVDPTDCFPTASAEVTKITLGSTFNSSTQPPNIPPDNTVTGPGLLAFQYSWFLGSTSPADQLPLGGPFTTTPMIGNLVPGTYYVFVTDPGTDCQSGPKEVVINDDDIVYPEVEIRQSQLQVSCDPALASGELIATADIGKPLNSRNNYANYDFFWYPNLDASGLPINAASDSTLSQLNAGDYSVEVLDKTTNCRTERLYIIEDQSSQFTPEVSISVDPRIHCTTPDGRIVIREIGYDPTSAYPFAPNFRTELYVGPSPDLSVPGTVLTNIPGALLNWELTGLDAGTIYTVKITDLNTGCFITDAREVPSNYTFPNISINIDNPLTNCDPAIPNGQLSAQVDGTIVGYSFEWTNAGGAVLSNEFIVSGLPEGVFTVTVTNNETACESDASETIEDAFVFPPVPLASTVQHMTDCITPDGWVTASVGGETMNHIFEWYDTDNATGGITFTGPDYKERPDGIYSVTARDILTGCVSQPDTALVRDMRVFPEIFFTTTPSFCEDVTGRGTGSIELQLQPANVLADEIQWTFLGIQEPYSDNVYAGMGSYITEQFPGKYRASLLTTKGCPAEGETIIPTEVMTYNLVTNNGDDKNDRFQIDCISRFPNNNVKIFNRSGVLVYEADGYDNNDVVFKGFGEKGVYATGNHLPVGTYFYIIDKRDGSKPKTGYLELTR